MTNPRTLLPALSGHKADVYHMVADMFLTAPSGHVRIEDFGSPSERREISPIVSYLARRGSEKLRLSLGISRKENGHLKGAILRHAVGQYEYVPDFVWPKRGEVDPGLVRAEDRRVRREANRVTASRRRARTTPDTPLPLESPQTAVEPPQTDVEPPQVVTPATSVVIALTDDVVVLQHEGKLIVATVMTATKL